MSCQWETSESGVKLFWNHKSRFYSGAERTRYLIGMFWSDESVLQRELADRDSDRYYAAEFEELTVNHVLNGEILAVVEDGEGAWKIVVTNNVVETV